MRQKEVKPQWNPTPSEEIAAIMKEIIHYPDGHIEKVKYLRRVEELKKKLAEEEY